MIFRKFITTTVSVLKYIKWKWEQEVGNKVEEFQKNSKKWKNPREEFKEEVEGTWAEKNAFCLLHPREHYWPDKGAKHCQRFTMRSILLRFSLQAIYQESKNCFIYLNLSSSEKDMKRSSNSHYSLTCCRSSIIGVFTLPGILPAVINIEFSLQII